MRGLPFHQQTVQRIENGERAIRLDEAHVIAELFDLPLETMLSNYEGPLAAAADAVHHIGRQAESVSLYAAESYDEFYEAFNELADAFAELLESSGRRPTPGVIWAAAWLIKASWVLDALTELSRFSFGINSTDPEWQNGPDSLHMRSIPHDWIANENADIWLGLPEDQNPVFLAERTRAELQEWLRAADDAEQSEAR